MRGEALNAHTEAVATRVALVLAAISLAFVVPPYLGQPFAGEHGHYSFGAWLMLHGAVPYRDVWDNNAPGVFVLHWVAEILWGHGMDSIRWFDLLWMSGALVLVHRVARTVFGPLDAALAVLFVATHYFTLGYRSTAQRDGFCVLPILAMLALALRTPRDGRDAALSAAGIGLATAVVFWIKPPLALAGAVCGLALLRRSGWRAANLGALAGGFLVPSALVLFALAHEGALRDAYEMVLVFNSRYVQERYPIIMELGLLGMMALREPIWIAGIAGLALATRSAGGRLVVAVVSVCFVVLLAQGKLLPYHLVPIRVFFCLGAAHLVAGALRAEAWRVPARIAAVAAMAAAVWGFVAAAQAQQYPRFWSVWLREGKSLIVERQERELTAFVARRTAPNETVVVWGLGTAGIVHYLAERESPTRFTRNYAFSLPGPDDPLLARWRDEFIAHIRAAPPKVIVVTSGDAWQAIGNLDSAQSFERFTALRDFVAANYQLAAEAQGGLRYRIYRRLD